MKVFFDTEFTGLRKGTELISIGLIAENNATFYAEFNDYSNVFIDDWIKNNVIDNLWFNDKDIYSHGEQKLTGTKFHYIVETKGRKEDIRIELTTWFNKLQADKIDIWSDVLAYDWMLFNDLMADYTEGYPNLPCKINYIPFDLATLFKIKAINPDINREDFLDKNRFVSREIIDNYFSNHNVKQHNALFDAIVIKKCYEKLMVVR